MGKVCGQCVHWEPSLTLGNCQKGHGAQYGISCCNYCDDYQTLEAKTIEDLQAKVEIATRWLRRWYDEEGACPNCMGSDKHRDDCELIDLI